LGRLSNPVAHGLGWIVVEQHDETFLVLVKDLTGDHDALARTNTPVLIYRDFH